MNELADRLRAAGCVWAEDEAALILETAHSPAEADAMADRRVAGEPIEIVVGWAAFCGLRIEVAAGVFVPRRRTEFLAMQAAALVRPDAVVLDMCCGTGAIAAVVANSLPTGRFELWACDIDAVAVTVARRNLAAYGATVLVSDLFAGLPPELRGRVDVLVANVPYVPSGEVAMLPAEAREYEPRRALDGGTDGLDVLRQMAADAGRWLSPGGLLLSELGAAQLPTALGLLGDAGLPAEPQRAGDGQACIVVATRER